MFLRHLRTYVNKCIFELQKQTEMLDSSFQIPDIGFRIPDSRNIGSWIHGDIAKGVLPSPLGMVKPLLLVKVILKGKKCNLAVKLSK